ncbi:hypothetical protein [Rhizorhabdus sp.]|uniref:hypothetical protein n=1 Tax=Rhizorhabdus sp. TaxID=1968843 RepID=UPI001B51B59A|nr:hypothetical protein [Rhizorhabdus sp.]MBP8234581.1 hypothetical protein [Rhizorhabdus sp.]
MRVIILEPDYFQALYLTETIERVGGVVIGPYSHAADIPSSMMSAADAALLNIDQPAELDQIIDLALLLLCEGCEVRLTTGYPDQHLPTAIAHVVTMTKPVTREQIIAFLSERQRRQSASSNLHVEGAHTLAATLSAIRSERD